MPKSDCIYSRPSVCLIFYAYIFYAMSQLGSTQVWCLASAQPLEGPVLCQVLSFTECRGYHPHTVLFYAYVIVLCYVIVMLYLGVVLSTCTAPGGSCVMPSIVFTECRGYRPHTVGYAISQLCSTQAWCLAPAHPLEGSALCLSPTVLRPYSRPIMCLTFYIILNNFHIILCASHSTMLAIDMLI